MEVRFGDACLDRLELDPKEDCGFAPEVVTAFRKRMQMIRAAPDEREFYALKSLRYEKSKGNRSHQRSMRLNDQWRLIIGLEGKGRDKVLIIVGIEDYH